MNSNRSSAPLTELRRASGTEGKTDQNPDLGTESRQESSFHFLANSLSDVQSYWNREACGSHFVEGQRGTAEFYENYRQFRYRVEWHIPALVPFADQKGKRVLEIGCGNGADGVMFARAGAQYVGVDLTEAAVEATRNHFRALGLEGRLEIENAEHLSFPDESFDFVYSHGVLHHTPHPESAFAELHRVLKPGGKAVLMLYHKSSFNYWVRIMGYMRLRVLLCILSRVRHFEEERAQLRARPNPVRGRPDTVWRIHYENFLRHGWSYLAAKNFLHHATDGPECPYAFVYTRASVRNIFCNFSRVETKVAHFPLRKYLRWGPRWAEKQLAPRIGWYLFIYLTK
jgi:SAM-dependent methyltransferase